MGRLLDIARATLAETEAQSAGPHERPAVMPPERVKPRGGAACGLPYCAGCYEVAPGVRIHPPKCGEGWKEWLLKWEPKGKIQ